MSIKIMQIIDLEARKVPSVVFHTKAWFRLRYKPFVFTGSSGFHKPDIANAA